MTSATGSVPGGTGSVPGGTGAAGGGTGSVPGGTGSAAEGDVGGAAEAGDVVRQVARVILLDPENRVLLMHGHEPDDPTDTWWFTPGGGLEGDETRAQAALRELAEETGLTDVELGPVLWRRHCSFPFAGRRWDQDEWYYLARTRHTGPVPGPQALTPLETRSLSGLRWWTSAELSAAHETVYPIRLAELLRTLLDEGPPSTPVVLAPEIV
ncbi:DNA mismatch repair protein MutT [Streptomyces hydrogenans]|uniref:DNA mismatch repair protein MutT n=1 Tax=Streptomyces hydrogenans TaxID=1873719 RepID=A0ABQ3P3Z1_9ACTN|nr:DNA mismatch repair protein MutT [Streptomyces hydrogenans]